MTELAAVVLAAGEGRRLRPLTTLAPKPLCPVGNIALLDWAMDRVSAIAGTGPDHVAVNAHHLADQLVAHVGDRAQVSVEPELLGTAGALGALRDWLDGRDVLLTNADTLLLPRHRAAATALAELAARRGGPPRLLVSRPSPSQPADFPDAGDERGWRYVGACVMSWTDVVTLKPTPSGLYEALWRRYAERAGLDLVPFDGTAVDCGTPADYLAANLLLSGGESVIGPGAVVDGTVQHCVVWPDSVVSADEHLLRTIRAGRGDRLMTVTC